MIFNKLVVAAGAWLLCVGLAALPVRGQQMLEQGSVEEVEASGKSMPLLTFDADFDTTGVASPEATVSLAIDEQGLRVDTAIVDNQYPGITLSAPSGSWDLSAWRWVRLDVDNVGERDIRLGLRADNPGADDDVSLRMFVIADVPAGQKETISLPIYSTDWALPFLSQLVGMREAPGQSQIDPSQVEKFILFSVRPESNESFVVSNLRVQGEVTPIELSEFLPFIDRYGQYVHTEWPGKATSDDDLLAQVESEAADLAANSGPSSFNQYGGWADGPQLEATGHFRVTKREGMWWLVDPDGRLFFSTGPDCLNIRASGATGVEHRETYFEWLPPREGDELSEHYFVNESWAPHGFYKDKLPFTMFGFYNANLQRKYGDDWRDDFADLAHLRVRSWGMNTIAAWGDPLIYRRQKTAYTTHVWVSGARPIEGSTGYWGQFPDVFDPGFREAARESIAEYEQEQTDPWNIGYYVDNEMGWGDETSLAIAALTSPPDQAAKIELIKDLQINHRNIEALNAAWGTDYGSWDDMLQRQDEPPELDRARADLEPFYQKLCETYFRTIKEELKAVAPDKLYLGARFAWRNDVAVRASARYCDVVSYNAYQASVADLRLPKGIDRPLMIGEFNFMSGDTRGFGGPSISAIDQAHRGERYISYVEGALENPQIVGVHWFQYSDQSPAGRPDEENFNAGIVSLTDYPHAGLVDGIREIGYRMYDVRAAAMNAE
ncbi:MAG: beta-agarase [Planctomycetota bacterium]